VVVDSKIGEDGDYSKVSDGMYAMMGLGEETGKIGGGGGMGPTSRNKATSYFYIFIFSYFSFASKRKGNRLRDWAPQFRVDWCRTNKTP
jgi:hypothetical protein